MKVTHILGAALAVTAIACSHHNDPAAPSSAKPGVTDEADLVNPANNSGGYCTRQYFVDLRTMKSVAAKYGAHVREVFEAGATVENLINLEPAYAHQCQVYIDTYKTATSCILTETSPKEKRPVAKGYIGNQDVINDCKTFFGTLVTEKQYDQTGE